MKKLNHEYTDHILMTGYRRILLGFLTLLLIASIMIPMTQAQSDSPDITVSPGESIQSAVNAANPGDTIQLEQGTYEQGVIINKSLTITASGDVTLDGDAIDTPNGIVVDAADVTIEGVEIARFSDDGIRVRGDILDQRQIEIVDVTSRLNGDSNIVVDSGTERDTILLSGVTSRNNGNNGVGPGIDINAENVTIEDVTVQEADRSGIDVTAGSQGIVTIERTVVSGGSGGDDFRQDDHGITVRSAKKLSINDTEVTNSQDQGIRLSGTDAIAGGRTVRFTNVTSRSNEGNAIFVGGTTDRDSVLMRGVGAGNNGGPGIDINAENVTVEDATVREVDRSGINVTAGSQGSVTIDDVTVREAGRSGIDVTAGSEGTVTIERTVVSSGSGDDDFRQDDQGITVRSAKKLSINDTEVTNSQDQGIALFNTDAVAGGRTVRFSNLTSRSNEGNDIFVGGTTDRDSVLMRGVDAGNNGGGPSINIDSENVTIEDATVREADRSGIDVTAGSEGTVTIERTVVSGGSGGNDFDNAHDGIAVRSAKKLTISDTELTNTQKNGVSVLENSVAAGGRTVVLNNITSEANGNVGVLIDGTTDADSVSIVNSTIRSNDNDGIEIVIETATVSQTRISNNTDAGIRFEGAFTGGTVDRSSILNNQGPEIINSIDDATVDATNNWWGVPTGPSETEITGEVLVENPLNAPPGTISAAPELNVVSQPSGAVSGDSTFEIGYQIATPTEAPTAFTLAVPTTSANLSVAGFAGEIQGPNPDGTPPSTSTTAVDPGQTASVTVTYRVAAGATGTGNVTVEASSPGLEETGSATTTVELGEPAVPSTPRGRALQVAGVEDPAAISQRDITVAITLRDRGQAANGVNVSQRDITTLITLRDRAN